MCGIAGLLDTSASLSEDRLAAAARGMANSIRHRGPDAEGIWVDASAGIALGHRRLSIIDLSEAGAQPMASSCRRLIISYNGEIYNADSLREELQKAGRTFRGHSDTEVIVEACAEWGVRPAVERLIGMFAFCVWDRTTRRLWLVRDRVGIKPIYWGRFGTRFVFGSELKALRACPGWKPELDRDALCAYLRYNYVPAPYSIYRGVRKLEPGCLLSIQSNGDVHEERYWDLRTIAAKGITEAQPMDADEMVAELDALLGDAVRRRMVADVPLGAFLSGGIDSSTVVALMQAASSRPVKTFSIGFHEPGYDEARHAKEVARHLGTEHTELYVEPDHARAVIPNLVEWWDEPFADSSQIPTYLVSEMTRRHVTVALSGDGGDELFAGYNRYVWAERLWKRLRRVPGPARAAAARMIRGVPTGVWDRVFKLVPTKRRVRQAGEKMHKLAGTLTVRDPGALYPRFVSHWEQPGEIVMGSREPDSIIWDPTLSDAIPGFTDRMQLIDTVTYLPDDILTKVDRASMAVSLEARVPLLDHRVVEFVWRTPREHLMRAGTPKWPLRQVLDKYVPRSLIDRPKMGFAVPIHSWLRGPLRDWAEDLLDERRLREEGNFAAGLIRAEWAEHLAGRGYGQYKLWDILMFQAWQDRWMGAGDQTAVASANG
jgi:asparagine synthase (glutamine-hydrolysing)